MIRGIGQRLDPWDLQMLVSIRNSFSYQKVFDGTSSLFFLFMASITTCPGFILDIPLPCWPLMGKTLNSFFCWLLILLRTCRAVNHEIPKAHFEDPRRVDLKARSGQLAKSRIMLVDFEFLRVLGKE